MLHSTTTAGAVLALFCHAAHAAHPADPAEAVRVTVRIEATATDIANIVGVIEVRCHAATDGGAGLTPTPTPTPCPSRLRLVNALALLPAPTDDRTAVRTWVGREDAGESIWSPSPSPDLQPPAQAGLGLHGEYTFHTRLPHRYGDVGYSGRGVRGALHANGGWYPQVVDDASGADRIVVAEWDVKVSGPGVVVINGAVGQGRSHWKGTSDRAALAVVPNGRVRPIPSTSLTLVDLPGLTPTSHALGRRWLAAIAPTAAGLTLPGAPLRQDPSAIVPLLQPVTLVQGTDLLHLARPAPGMVYLSDRSFRLVWLFRPTHARGVRQALISAATPLPSGWDRDFVADAVARSLPAADLRKTLGWLGWNPVVDALLNDGTLPFYADIFAEPFEDDPQLLDRIEARTPARAASRQLDDLLGSGAALAEAARMLGDDALPGPDGPRRPADPVPPALRRGWTTAYDPDQDYAIEIEGGRPIAVVRTADPLAPAEVVRVTADGQTHAWLTGTGSDRLKVDERDAVRVDGAHIDQHTRANDRWPARWDVILSGGAAGLSPTQGNLHLWGDLLLRPQGDTRNLGIGAIEHDEQDIVTLSVGYVWAFGPLLNRQRRAQRLVFLVDGSWLDPAFRPTTTGAYAMGGYVGWSWETRQEEALSGHRISASIGGGLVPGSTERWASTGVAATQLFSISPRQVLAVRGKVGWASGDVEHRMLTLGGADDLRSIPESLFVGNEKVIGNLEYRAALFRNAQIPLPLLWATELQLAPGLEFGSAWANDGSSLAAAGVSLGVHGVVDALGGRPMLAGVTVAAPVWGTAPLWTETPVDALQVYIDFNQGF